MWHVSSRSGLATLRTARTSVSAVSQQASCAAQLGSLCASSLIDCRTLNGHRRRVWMHGCLVPEPAAAVSQHKLPPSPAITRMSRWWIVFTIYWLYGAITSSLVRLHRTTGPGRAGRLLISHLRYNATAAAIVCARAWSQLDRQSSRMMLVPATVATSSLLVQSFTTRMYLPERIRVREKTLEFFSAVSSTLSPYLYTVPIN